MKSRALTDVPVDAGWFFGGVAYGLEPLVLPRVGEPDAAWADDETEAATGEWFTRACTRLRPDDRPSRPEVERSTQPSELFWFRWIIGHQVCFVIWRLMSQVLDEAGAGRRPPESALTPLRRYVNAYSAMLLYTGSCPRDLYQVLIRPSMRRWHRAFSGAWAPDFAPVRELLRSRLPAWSHGLPTAELREAIRLHSVVHDMVAAKLVPDGMSLLRLASVRRHDHRMAGMIYDCYFMTVRQSISGHEVVTQLLRRLIAIAQDVDANGLYTDDGRDELPVDVAFAEAMQYEDRLHTILFDTACSAVSAVVETGRAPS